MRNKCNLIVTLLLLITFTSGISFGQIHFGVFADCQFCNCETEGSRYYRDSSGKLADCIAHFNKNKQLGFVVNLGDLIDRNFESYTLLEPVLKQIEKPLFHVPGNHDLEVEPALRSQVPRVLGLAQMYHSFQKEDWHFVFLNGNDISFLSSNPDVVRQAEKITTRLKAEGKPNYHPWNGGLGHKQLEWLENQLQEAENNNLKVAVFCHYPLLPLESHTLWNQEETLALLEKYSCVKLWLNGHNHTGNYTFHHGIHFVNLKGMVETKTENAFAEIVLSSDVIEIKGYGREESRKLPVEN